MIQNKLTYKEFRDKGYIFDVTDGNNVIIEDISRGNGLRSIIIFGSPFIKKDYKNEDEFLAAIWEYGKKYINKREEK